MLSLTSVSSEGPRRRRALGPHTSRPTSSAFNLAQPGQVAQLTHVNEDVLNGITLGDVEEIAYTSGTAPRSRDGS